VTEAGGILFLLSMALMMIGPLDRTLTTRRPFRSPTIHGPALRAAYPIEPAAPEIEQVVQALDHIPDVRTN
jgi:hypothetical protein